ncbi:MAG: adenosylcobinamide-GDP ribazoletransferase [Deltaproteobacteria bacterium HGW-Deltaproteobacteria-19]|jgi:adenosylcobinamide-GDP ribazoletransferase|nr:MAG: adenosylcobinamide-GDP ribazoletransferase [Deltaproteobacteria bacterium HGW-Deltaproteobacteria-19]
MKPLLAAFRFLTILPLGRRPERSEDLAGSVLFFPPVGLFIGIVALIVDSVALAALPSLPAAACTVLVLIALSGGLHMDGLADTADGFGSARPRERVLEIMRDSRIGTMGVVAVVSAILLKVVFLDAVPLSLRIQAVILMPVAGRSALVWSMAWLPYARSEGGLATAFHRKVSSVHALWALVFLLACGAGMGGWPGVAAAAMVLAVISGWLVICRRKIGGFTGDTLGASCEIAEIVPVIVLALWPSLGI